MTNAPSTIPGPMGSMKPHRGTLILVLGILSIVLCAICGPIAWIMGNGDIREMKAGRMDPEGMGLTTAGKICGIVGTVFMILGLIYIVVMFLFVGAVAVGGAAGAAGSRTPFILP